MGTEAAKTARNLEDARAFGLPYLSAEEANDRIVELHQEVGDLKCANKLLDATIERLKTKNAALVSRNARLEDGVKAISAHCVWRTTKVCDVDCGGRAFCDVEGLSPVCLENHAGAAQAS